MQVAIVSGFAFHWLREWRVFWWPITEGSNGKLKQTQFTFDAQLKTAPTCGVPLFLQSYPAVMVGSSMNDDRVPYWLPLKWVARLRDQLSSLKQSERPFVVCSVDYYGGHFGSENTQHRFEQVEE